MLIYRKKTSDCFQMVYFFREFVYNEITMRIWVKLITDGKIKRDFVDEKNEKLTYSMFFDYLTEISQILDIPTPVLLKTHIFNFAKFNHVKFTKKDFVESFSYDQLLIENLY